MKPIKILLIEDNPGDARLLSEILVDVHTALFELEWVDRLSKGLERLKGAQFDVVLLDLNLPDGAGMKTFTEVRNNTPEVPIIILSGLADEKMAVQTVREGAQDYIVKGNIDGNLLERSIHYAIERKRAEKALERSENKYRNIFRLSPEVILLLDDKGSIVDVSPRMEDWLGYTSKELIGNNVFQSALMIEESRRLASRMFARRMIGEDLPPYEAGQRVGVALLTGLDPLAVHEVRMRAVNHHDAVGLWSVASEPCRPIDYLDAGPPGVVAVPGVVLSVAVY